AIRNPEESRRVRPAHPEGVPREPGAAAGGRGGVLRAAFDRAAPDPRGDRAVALARSRAAARYARALPRLDLSGAGEAGGRGACALRRASRGAGLAAARHADLLQLARVHGAGERDVD